MFDDPSSDEEDKNRQTHYLKKLSRDLPSWGGTWAFRELVMERFADEAAYFPTPRPDSVYERVHRFIDATLEDLEKDVSDDAQLVVLAHSLGAHIMSNYIYDVVEKKTEPRVRPDGFQSFQSFANFVSFGANIPIFTFSLPQVQPIGFPVQGVEAPKGWWRNYFSRYDPLGYPLGPVPGYDVKVGPDNEIWDERIDVGWHVNKFTPFSHNAYWNSPRLAGRIVDVFEQALN